MNIEKQEHMKRYGSILYCPERGVLCVYMEDRWATGCDRQGGCLLDDPEYMAMKEVQRKNRNRNDKQAREEAEREKKDPPAPIRTQNKYPEDLILKRIEKLEAESREAYRRDRPKVGERKLHEAMVLRRELRRRNS